MSYSIDMDNRQLKKVGIKNIRKFKAAIKAIDKAFEKLGQLNEPILVFEFGDSILIKPDTWENKGSNDEESDIASIGLDNLNADSGAF